MTITVSKGFGISLYASNLGDAKQLAIGDKGTLFVGSSKSGLLTALVDKDNNGQVDYRYTIGRNIHRPDAIAFYQGDLYVAIGAGCNACLPEDPKGGIVEINLKTGEALQVASGVRKVLGMDWSPVTQKLWFGDNGRDWMGDNIPPDEINILETKGTHFGFPYLHGSKVQEPRFKQPNELVINKPVYELPAQVTPVGLHFYRGKQFPAEYQGQLFLAENGSTNRSSKVGYQVVKLAINDQMIVNRTPVVSFLDGEFPVAKPHSLVTAPDGAMYISDDFKGNIYRLYYKGSKQ